MKPIHVIRNQALCREFIATQDIGKMFEPVPGETNATCLLISHVGYLIGQNFNGDLTIILLSKSDGWTQPEADALWRTLNQGVENVQMHAFANANN